MTKSPIRAAIFDFGGVLLDWNPRNLYRHLIEDPLQIDQFLSEIKFTEWNQQQDKGRPFSLGIAELSKQFPQYADLIRAYHDRWIESIAGPITGSIALLGKLKGLGYLLHGLSNWSAETFPIACAEYDFFKLFDGIIISGEVKLIKPDPAIFMLTLKRIGLAASECLLVDDSRPNIITARALGFSTIEFRSPGQLELELQQWGLLEPSDLEHRY